MRPVKVKDDIYWVGAVDWDLRDFHGYLTQRGSSYNAYLIMDEKITLVDTVKAYLVEEMLDRIAHVVDPSKIDYIICNHVEMDHSGGITRLMELAPNATIITSPNGQRGLKAHYKRDWPMQVVKTGDRLSLGKRNLSFVLTQMVHWPDNMVAYMPEEKILFSNDAFGQHIASMERFDDQFSYHLIMEEAKKYYANIVLPYGAQVQNALQALAGLEIDLIATSHGLLWRSHVPEILEEYGKWAANYTEEKALIIYDTMWESTKKIAYAIQRAFEHKGIDSKMVNLDSNHMSDIMTELITAKYVCVGSPTLNNNMLPSVAAFLTYLKGLAPKQRVGLAFGSYGWGGQGVAQIEEALKAAGFDMLKPVKAQYIPDERALEEITAQVEAVVGG
ncbi:rubredoxin-oxygen oxidoreductase, putative [Heliomicrobium modesticaldum Ice1]|uniref:Rubredoxin-oxygen oxidoreductase, putative n=1 Tax=Heliobacterium modesticaldum (strain ATCC 51547 / Ice1) TaxID=498761 RepID=B0TG05_HELMI|nr:flavodoxin domain-containing protein [Heliomicrobium modesticaldum]ABZ83162.1 rubredoxin-oxygen oxidoreductase, putative [Heliomicrobium modesticaldum Ice1]